MHWPLDGQKAVLPTMFCFFLIFFPPCFLAVQPELNNPGYSHYKSCCLDLRPQTGDRLCNLVSFSIPLGFTGRCLTLLAGYLLATLKATFLLTTQLGSHTYNVCTIDIRAYVHAHRHTYKNTYTYVCTANTTVLMLNGPYLHFFFFQHCHTLYAF